MAALAPPRLPPRVGVADHDGLRRLHFRLWQLMVTAITVLLTGWCFTLGPIPAIIAIMVAKHVLVAVLVVGLDYEAHCDVEPGRPG
jgi:hypothetical protein